MGIDLLNQLREYIEGLGQDTTHLWESPESVHSSVVIATALYRSRRITKQEYVFYCTSPIERIFEHRISIGEYSTEFDSINDAMAELRKDYGLEEYDEWLSGEAPEDYEHLNVQWTAIYDKYHIINFKEFAPDDLFKMYEDDPDEFNKFRERGRRAVYHSDEISYAIRDIIIRYEEDAKKAAHNNAYSAAITSLGAGMEGLLLLRCLRSPVKATRTAKKLPKRKRPKKPEDPTKWSFNNLLNVCLEANWLPNLKTSYAKYNSIGLARYLKLLRNYIHPGRHASEKPWSVICERDYKDAHAIYITLLSQIGTRSRPKKDSNIDKLHRITEEITDRMKNE